MQITNDSIYSISPEHNDYQFKERIHQLDYETLYLLSSNLTLYKSEEHSSSWFPSAELIFGNAKPQYAFGNLTVDQKPTENNCHIHFAPLMDLPFNKNTLMYEPNDTQIAKMALMGYEDLLNLLDFYSRCDAENIPRPKTLIAETSINMAQAIEGLGFKNTFNKEFSTEADPKLRQLGANVNFLQENRPILQGKLDLLIRGCARRGITLESVRAEEILKYANKKTKNKKEVEDLIRKLQSA